jgi:hypothetical protein
LKHVFSETGFFSTPQVEPVSREREREREREGEREGERERE